MHPSRVLPDEPLTSLDDYLARGGGEGLRRARELGPGGTIDLVLAAGLRGRGGAGFPTGRKWSGIRNTGPYAGDVFLVVNASEGEPGTYKDRPLMQRNPYQLVEGTSIAAETIGAVEVFVCVKETFEREMETVGRAMKEMGDAGVLCDAPMTLVAGPDEYLFGEEKAMLEVVQGNSPQPRMHPPYVYGLWGTVSQQGWEGSSRLRGADLDVQVSNPTDVNNAETMVQTAGILAHGAEWYRELGTEQTPGTHVFAMVGDVQHAAFGERAPGMTLGELIDDLGGGVAPGRKVKAVLSGVANPVLTGEQLDTVVSYEGFDAAGSGMGACGYIVYDDATSAVSIAQMVSRFLYVESCGQCRACKLGTQAITERIDAIAAGEGTMHDIDMIGARLLNVTDQNRCFLPTQEQRVISSLLRAFPDDWVRAVEERRAVLRIPIPKIKDIHDGVAVYDEKQMRKRPDWSYEPAR